MTSQLIIYNQQREIKMKWLEVIKKFFQSFKGKIKLNRLTQASLAISLVLLCRKIFMRNVSSAEAKVILENISSFYDKLRNNNIKNVSILTNSISYTDLQEKVFQAILPRHAQSALESELRSNNINFNYLKGATSKPSTFLILLMWALVGFTVYTFFIHPDHSDLSTSSKPQKAINFDNIVGLEESKQSLREIIEYMKDPQRYMDIGARMRKGIIFYGPSGTGKTTLAKATAGQAGVPFYSCNASEFCEIYVGVGPKRVKQLFRKARQTAPSIIYIDEIDAIGNRRQSGMFNESANSEKNSTINQLLSQMDGFSSQQNVLVIGSTNRVEMIDQSLLRAGRFDLKIKIPLPNEEDRYQILKYHLTGKKFNLEEQYLRRVVNNLDDWSGADLQNLANESVYASLRAQSNEITEQIFTQTLLKLRQQLCH